MTKRAAGLLGLLLALAGCPGGDSGADASVRKDAGIRPDADEVIIGEDAGPVGVDTGGAAPDAGTAGIGWCTLQFPPSASIAVGAKVAVFGQVYVAGETELNGARTDVEGQVGYGAQGTDGATEASWVWASAAFNKDDANNDEYKAELSPAVGVYGYAYRFRYKGGAWTYCDLNGSGDGYDKAKQGALTVTEVKPPEISWCNIAGPLTATAKVGAEVLVSGQVLVTGLTSAAGQGAGIVGQVGYGPVGSDPRASTDWTWGSATFLKDVGDNDEYQGRVVPANPGKYAYAYRFRLNTGDAVYCDTVGHAPAEFDATKLGALDVTALTVDWCNLQFPASAKLTVGDSLTAFGQVLVVGSTEVKGAGADVEGELGVGAKGTDGATDASWTWTKAAFNTDEGNNDEYTAAFKPAAIGDYEYAYRFRFKGGTWTYCDLDSSTNGYDKTKQGALNVAAVKPPQVDWCDTHFPPSATITVGEKAPIFGQVFVAGVTDKVAAGVDVEGQVGVGAKGTDGSTDASWTWTAATFNRDETSNDEYKAELSPATVGDYEYTYRFRFKGGAWTYCDLDSSTNGYDKAQQGALKVAAVKPPQVDWCNLESPVSVASLVGDPVTISGQVYVSNVTPGDGAGAEIEGQVGFGPAGSDGSAGGAWTWTAATYLKEVGNNDEYRGDIAPSSEGTYEFAYRFRYKGGAWTYCDSDSSTNGYSKDLQGDLQVNPQPALTIDYCVLQWPSSGTVVEGTTFTIYGQVYKAGFTEPAGKATNIDGQFGYGPAGTDGSTDAAWTWAPATFNKDASNNDEFLGAITATQGNYGYAYRFRYKQGAWTYCDLDGSTNGYAKAQQGALTVNAPVALWSQLRGLTAGVENVGTQVKVEAEVFVAGLTDKAGQGTGITADVGFGPVTDLPSAASWTWKSAAYAGDAGGTAGTTNDLYAGWFVAPAAGSYAVAMRFTKGGESYYADLDGSTGVALVELAHLATFPEPAKADNDIGWCNLQWPLTLTAAPGAETPLAFGQVWVDTVTNGTGQGAGIASQLGWGTVAASPRTDAFTWTSAVWNADSGNNDEYKASFVAPAAGTYRYVFRVRRNKGWTYCDIDGSTGAAEFDPAKSGVLTVQ